MTATYALPSLVDLSIFKLSNIPTPTSDLIPLPPHLKDSLRHLLLRRGSLNGGDLAALLHPKVTQVDLSDSNIKQDHLTALSSCTKLSKLNLNQPRPTPPHQPNQDSEEILSLLVSSFKNLTVLYLRNCLHLTDAVVSRLPLNSQLVHLDLGGCSSLGDNGLSHLSAACPNLTSLSLARTRVTDSGLYTLSQAACDLTEDRWLSGCH
jgi:Leucine-rich repeat (LRR) protein